LTGYLPGTPLVDVLVHHGRLALARRDENEPPRPPPHLITLGFAVRNVSRWWPWCASPTSHLCEILHSKSPDGSFVAKEPLEFRN